MAETPIKGYTPVSEKQKSIVNNFKELEERALRLLDSMQSMIEYQNDTFDPRWHSIARTELQKAFMCANRSVMNPQRIALPEDMAGES